MQPVPEPSHFQSIIFALQNYWAEQGCLIWQPYYSQVGAGTMNPATFLRVLGPEPWNVAYVEPSVRPDDARYGENPYRLQQHYQFQVILKPDPGNPQELYLKSLQALGIDPQQHDIRFVEDNWESPALGAWGLGWEVWLDGQEITQFTYFQQAGGINLNPVSVEITYGLERIAMALQGRYNFRDIQWNKNYTYGDVNLQAEQEHSRYYFEKADVDGLRKMYDLFEKEARAALDNSLVLPAHDYILKCSHTFNVLDTRGAVGVAERQALFGRMRDLSRRVSELYVQKRQELEFPWQGKPVISTPTVSISEPGKSASSDPDGTLLFEIGCEELPTEDLNLAVNALKSELAAGLTALRLDFKDARVYSTPRRLVLYVTGLAEKQQDFAQTVKGPPAARAYDAQGNLTPAAEGFARSKGVSLENLSVEKIDGGEYLVAMVHQLGKPAADVLPEMLANIVSSLRFEKSMRWNETNVPFSRPVRWLLALLNGKVLPVEFASLRAGRLTRGLRFNEPAAVACGSALDYFKFLSSEGILADPVERRAAIVEQVRALAKSCAADETVDESLLDEVNNLVEAPTAFLGKFDEKNLDLPPEVLIGVMKKHQRYFPLRAKNGSLMAGFIAVRNGGNQHLDTVTHGNEEVIRARFADAAFFIHEDSQTPLAQFAQNLASLAFHPKLGSFLEKSNRVRALVDAFSGSVNMNESEIKTAQRAAELCKADLVTKMVVEMTTLQGVIGRIYAERDGEDKAVARAIEEHYWPRFAGDKTPSTKPALLVGIADRIDTLVGLFAAGMAPSGTKDPFGLRRTAIGLQTCLIESGLEFNLQTALHAAAQHYSEKIQISDESIQQCVHFLHQRLDAMLMESGCTYDSVQAITAVQHNNPAGAARSTRSLDQHKQDSTWKDLLAAYSRCVRITRYQEQKFVVDERLLTEKIEKELLQAVREAESKPHQAGDVNDFIERFKPLIAPITAFFDQVLVMAEDQALRQSRLGLLQRISDLAAGVADFSKLEGF